MLWNLSSNVEKKNRLQTRNLVLIQTKVVWFSFVKTYGWRIPTWADSLVWKQQFLLWYFWVLFVFPACLFLNPGELSCLWDSVVRLFRSGDTSVILSALLSDSSASCCILGGEISQTTGKCVLWAGWDVGMGVSPICRGEWLRHLWRTCWSLCSQLRVSCWTVTAWPHTTRNPLELGQTEVCELGRASFGL